MKYTFSKEDGSQKTVEIADEWLVKTKRNLGISSHEAIQLWLCDNGYISDEEQEALNQKAASANAGLRVQSKERKKPTRKPDQVKRDIIDYIFNCLGTADMGQTWQINNINVVNIERVVSFTVGDDQYELTLSKKRKPKA